MNLVYVIGLIPTIKDENSLLQTLRGPDYFGQYGEIEKIVVSKAKSTSPTQGIGVYVTYARKEDAALCIGSVDGSLNGERVLRAQYGTTKYCSAFLRGETCTNKNCSFLHETGEDGQGTSLQNESHSRPISKPVPTFYASQMAPPARPISVTPSNASQPMARQGSTDDNSRKGSTDASALPSSASWANSSGQVQKTRRLSHSTSQATPSPVVPMAVPIGRPTIPTPISDEAVPSRNSAAVASNAIEITKRAQKSPQQSFGQEQGTAFDRILKNAMNPNCRFVFDESMFSAEELQVLSNYPSFIDPYGGVKQRLMRQREQERRLAADIESDEARQQQVQAQAHAAMDDPEDEQLGGSLALGGEPEDNPRSASGRGAIGRPGVPNDFLADQFSGMNLNTRNINAQERSQPGYNRSNPVGSDMFDLDRQVSQSQQDPMQGHQRQNSRYFNNDVKSSSGMFQNQHSSGYQSSVQGPPPGLATVGTPPFSGGGRFAHGQGFTSTVNAGFGALKDGNADLHHRGRAGTNDVAKRELLLSLQNPLRSPPSQASAPGLLNSLYGQYTGAYQDPGLVKQKKKGKKHRHANTSSSGGGVGDLADPSILHARVQGGPGVGQGLFGGNQGGFNQSNMAYGGNYSRGWQ